MIEVKVVKGGERVRRKGERDTQMKLEHEAPTDGLEPQPTTPHSWKGKRNINRQRGLHVREPDVSSVSERF